MLCVVPCAKWQPESTESVLADNPKDLHFRVGLAWGHMNGGTLTDFGADVHLNLSPERTQRLPDHIVGVYGIHEEVVREMLSKIDASHTELAWGIERIVRMTKRIFAGGSGVHLWHMCIDGESRYTFTSDFVVPDIDDLPFMVCPSMDGAISAMYTLILERDCLSAKSQRECAFEIATKMGRALAESAEANERKRHTNIQLSRDLTDLRLRAQILKCHAKGLRAKLGLSEEFPGRLNIPI